MGMDLYHLAVIDGKKVGLAEKVKLYNDCYKNGFDPPQELMDFLDHHIPSFDPDGLFGEIDVLQDELVRVPIEDDDEIIYLKDLPEGTIGISWSWA